MNTQELIQRYKIALKIDEQAIDTMNSEWAAYCEAHLWD